MSAYVCGVIVVGADYLEEDAELVGRLKEGDVDAFTMLLHRYSNMVFGVAVHIVGDFHLAEDVSQEVFLRVFRSIQTLEQPERLPSWLYTVAKRTSLNYLRAHRRVVDTEISTDETADLISHSTDEVAMQRERWDQIQRALGSLTPMGRQTAILYYLAERNTRDIAKFLGISIEAVESRLRRARQQLKKELADMVDMGLSEARLGESFTDHMKMLAEQVSKYLSEGHQVDALSVAREAVALNPSDRNLRKQLAHILSNVGDQNHDPILLAEAEAIYLDLCKEDPDAFHGLGYTYMYMGNLDKAIECFERLKGPHVDGRIALAQALLSKGEYERAIAVNQEVLFCALGEVLLALGGMSTLARRTGDRESINRYARVSAQIAQTFSPDPQFLFHAWHAYINLARNYVEKGQREEAIEALGHGADCAYIASKRETSPFFAKLTTSTSRTNPGTDLDWFLEIVTGKHFVALQVDEDYQQLMAQIRRKLLEFQAN